MCTQDSISSPRISSHQRTALNTPAMYKCVWRAFVSVPEGYSFIYVVILTCLLWLYCECPSLIPSIGATALMLLSQSVGFLTETASTDINECWLWLVPDPYHLLCACRVETKEIRLRPTTDTGDVVVKVKAVAKFLEKVSSLTAVSNIIGSQWSIFQS